MLAERELEPSPLPPPAIPCAQVFESRGPEEASKYYRARYYDSKIGRFLSEDPIGLQGGINYYTYVENDPVNWVDPFGLVTLDPGPPPAPPTGSTSLFAWWWYHMQLDLWRNRQDPVQAMLSLPGPAACVSAPVGGVITGFTKHGLNSVISHPGGGVSPSATLRAVRNPVAVVPGGSGASATIKYVGADATVVVNQEGKVVTAWPTASSGARCVPCTQ